MGVTQGTEGRVCLGHRSGWNKGNISWMENVGKHRVQNSEEGRMERRAGEWHVRYGWKRLEDSVWQTGATDRGECEGDQHEQGMMCVE